MLLTSRPNTAEAMSSAALWAVSKFIRLAGPAIEASHPASVLRTLRDNLPVGLLADSTYESDHVSLHAGDRLILVTHGVTDAENARGDFFGDSRLETVAAKSLSMEDIFSAVANFCGGTPLSDDCTVVDLVYSG